MDDPSTRDPAEESAANAGEREFLARRRDLEREFDGKLRDLKAQHKRLVDRLEQDRAEWETRRKQQQKDLADREERLRRREDNKERAVEAKADERKERDALRLRIRELEERGLDAKTAIGRLEERLAKALRAQSGAQNLLTAFAGVSLVCGLVWLIIALQGSDRTSLLLAGLFLLLVGFLSALRLRLRPGRPTRP